MHGAVDTPHVLIDERILPRRFLVVSNRLPYQLNIEGGRVTTKRGLGGLVTALDPILRRTGGVWMGWTGSYDPLPDRVPLDEDPAQDKKYHLRTVSLTRDEVEHYYLGYSNRAIWPLFHYFQEHCAFNRDDWESYRAVNRKFADAVVAEHQPGDLIWIHDYHLMLVPSMVRKQIPDARIGYFLHIPFPSAEVFFVEPHAEELLEGLFGADLIGFHVDAYVHNFLDAVSKFTPHRYSRSQRSIHVGGRKVHLGVYPISIDFEHFEALAKSEGMDERVQAIRDDYRADILAIGVDRLDYSKGILERLRAIEIMLDRYPDLRGAFTFVQISAPSRTKVEAYRTLREEIERMVGHINGRFGGRGGIPIDYRYEGYAQDELVAYYRASDVALVTPLRDGMNLVAKEYVTVQGENPGVLVLSRFAGAVHELSGATVVNPYDPETMAEQIYAAIRMPDDEKRRRMERMRASVRRNDIYWWLEKYLRDVMV